MKLTTVMFDLDGTLLPMDQDEFTKGYFKLLAKTMVPYGYGPEQLTNAVWAGTSAMVKNDGRKSNEEVFWEKFSEIYGQKGLDDKPLFDSFYANEFQNAKDFCGYDPMAVEIVKQLKSMGIRVVLATNPLFPALATESRMRWVGLDPVDFEFYTCYENISYCKPNPEYYKEIIKRLGCKPEECLMIGNDATEDMIAETVGIKVFLLTDNLVNKENKDISVYPNGNFKQALEYIKTMQ